MAAIGPLQETVSSLQGNDYWPNSAVCTCTLSR